MEEFPGMPEPRRGLSAAAAAAILLALAAVTFPRAVAAHVESMSIPELASVSPHVVVAVVEGRESRWNAQHTLLVTDYALRVEDRLRGQAPDRITLTVPGGTLGNVSDETCVTVSLDPGARYLLFLGNLDRPSFTPIVGAELGMIREVSGTWFRALVAAVRPLAAQPLAARPPRQRPSPALPAKTWDAKLRGKYIYHEIAKPPILVNPLTAGSAFSPWDQREMALWNLYAGDLFEVVATPSSTWAFGNGVSDIAGFPPDDQMLVNFGMTWGEIGNDVLAITISHKENGVLTEADVAVNPNRSWTVDEVVGMRYFQPYPFQEIILHELGHVWGLHHPSEEHVQAGWDSVMHYKDRHYYVEELFPDDTNAVRAAFPPGVSLRDGLISSYTTYWNTDVNLVDYVPARPSVSTVRASGGFTLTDPIKIENPGTVPLDNPLVEVYLTPKQRSFTGGVLLKRLRVPGTVPAGGLQVVDVGPLRVPAGTRAGTYFLAFFLRDPKDVYQANNGAWSNEDVTLKVTRR
ncbi:MAG TPA: hypothetical protein VGH73_20620 [Thermoanaerobaculia bacterium]|jgi:hypothetical protein